MMVEESQELSWTKVVEMQPSKKTLSPGRQILQTVGEKKKKDNLAFKQKTLGGWFKSSSWLLYITALQTHIYLAAL